MQSLCHDYYLDRDMLFFCQFIYMYVPYFELINYARNNHMEATKIEKHFFII